MRVPVYGLKGKVIGHLSLAKTFVEPVRVDLIRRVWIAQRAKARQIYAVDLLAGKRTSAHYHSMRHYRYTMMNREMARMKRIHNQGFLNYTARFVSQAIKGRKAHPPKNTKVWTKKINKKELVKALRSAITATTDKELILARGHKLDELKHIPLIIEDKIQDLKKIKDVMSTFSALGLKQELTRLGEKKIRAGRGKTRNRPYKKSVGPLLVIEEDKGISKAVANIPGIEFVKVQNLSADLLAPGGQAGRLCIWTKSSIEKLEAA